MTIALRPGAGRPRSRPCWTFTACRMSLVEAGCLGKWSQLVEDSGLVKTRGLLDEEVTGFAAKGVAEGYIHDGFSQRAEALQGLS